MQTHADELERHARDTKLGLFRGPEAFGHMVSSTGGEEIGLLTCKTGWLGTHQVKPHIRTLLCTYLSGMIEM